jgi:hypothetical protein
MENSTIGDFKGVSLKESEKWEELSIPTTTP